MLELIVVDGPQQGQTIRLNFDKAWFGRLPSCDFVFLGEGISRIHFSIQKRGDDYILVDNNSTNGTYVNQVRTVAVTLREGYEITVGSTRLRVRNVDTSSPIVFRFSAHWTGEEGGAHLIEQDSVFLGRKSICQIQLNDPAVAAVHAQMERRADGSVWIKDQSQGAGIYLNGQRIVEQQIRHMDLIGIGPFELAASLLGEVCHLEIQDRSAEAQPALENVPKNYREVVTPPHDAAGQAKPSAAIAAVPRWMQSKAPIWVPTSDILPNRFRARLLLACLVGVLLCAAAAVAAKWNTAFSPGPLTEVHAAMGCEACHIGAGRIAEANCQGCHENKTASPIHAQNHVGCAACHQEHHGAKFDLARAVGSGCQAAGCHVTVHAAEKRFLAAEPRPDPALKIPPAVALAAHFEAGDAMHDKHSGLSAGCAACHTAGDPSLLEAKPGQPGVRAKELKDIRMRCLGCHGFGPEATLRDRCYSCHLEHPTEKAGILTVLRFPDAPARPPIPIQGHLGSLLTLAGAAVVLPLMFMAGAAGSVLVNQRKLKAETRKRIHSAPQALLVSRAFPVPNIAGPKPSVNQAAGGNLRPRIDLDLCVGCGTCVHVCPFNVLEIVNEKAIAVRLDDCTGYAACAAECPTEAITLVTGGAMQLVELPNYDANLETNVPGLYLAGEVTGKALIKIAINQGKNVVDSILKSSPRDQNVPYDVIVVGAGPAGTSAALSAIREGLRVLVLEQGTRANTIRTYPRQKFVMAEPVMIPLYGPLWMEDTSKETLLEKWNEIMTATGLVVNEEEKVVRVVRAADCFEVESSKGVYRGSRVVLAIGKRGSPRKLGVPGEELSKVAYNMLDAEAYRGQAICVVGGGDSGLEAACGLARPDLGCRVWLVHRTEDFAKAKPRNQKKIKKCMDEGRMGVFFSSAVVEIRQRSVVVKTPTGAVEIENDFVFVMVGGENPKKFLTECGIEFSQRALG